MTPQDFDTRTWRDQPAELSTSVKLCSFSISIGADSIQVEIRRGSGSAWYVTLGNLFGSQTLLTDTAELALRAVEAVKHRHRGAPISPPPGCVLLGAAS